MRYAHPCIIFLNITALITAPTYRRVLLDTSINRDTLFIIYLEGETNSDGTQQYSYLISNLGEVSIRDLVDGDELPYVTSDGNPFVVSRQQTSAF